LSFNDPAYATGSNETEYNRCPDIKFKNVQGIGYIGRENSREYTRFYGR
jgi:hypothetical protein